MGRASSFLWRPHVGGFWAWGLQGWSVAKQLYSGQPQTQSARWAWLGPRTLCAVGDAAGGQPESEGSRCLDLCFCVKMNFFPSICKQDLPTQEVIMDVLTYCWCVLYTWKHGAFLTPGWCMVMQMQNSISDCQTSCYLNMLGCICLSNDCKKNQVKDNRVFQATTNLFKKQPWTCNCCTNAFQRHFMNAVFPVCET